VPGALWGPASAHGEHPGAAAQEVDFDEVHASAKQPFLLLAVLLPSRGGDFCSRRQELDGGHQAVARLGVDDVQGMQGRGFVCRGTIRRLGDAGNQRGDAAGGRRVGR